MSLRKRISESRERSARERARRREERRRAERAKSGVTAADRAKARAERAKARAREKATADEQAEAKRKAEAKPKAEEKAEARPKAERKAKAKPRSKAEPKSKVVATKPARLRGKPAEKRGERPAKLRRLRTPAAAASGRALMSGAGRVGTGARSVVAELLKLGREMVAIPVQLWLAAAEIAGAVVLRVWLRIVRPLAVWLWRTGRATLRYAQDHIKPAHAVIAVSLVAIGALVASQWLDYHSVSVGTDAYAGAVGEVAPPPEIESEVAGNAHAWVMLPLAVAALVVLTVALGGRRRAAALLIPIGIAVIAVAVIVDVPKGLDEGAASVAYEGASARLLEGFWMQIAAGAVLIGCGLLLPRYLRPAPARAAQAPAGPTLFQSAAAAAGRLARRRPRVRRPRRPAGRGGGRKLPSGRGKRKVQGAGT